MSIEAFLEQDKILMLALDHRGSFKKMLNPENPDAADTELAIQIKAEIIAALYDQMSGVLIDQDFGLPAYSKLELKEKPYLLPAEKSGYEKSTAGERLSAIKYSAAEISADGALGVKLLIYFNPHMESAKQQTETARKVLEDARSQNLPLFLEIVTYGQPEGKKIVVESLMYLLDKGIRPDVYKLEYPGSPEACNMVDSMLDGIPWILLTRGGDFDSFVRHLQHASDAGCSGFLAGRSLWQEMVSMPDKTERTDFLNETVKDRFRAISSIILK